MAAKALGRHRRAAWATGLSLLVHAVVLTGMVAGIKVLRPPPESQAIELQLIPPLQRPPPPPKPLPEPARRTAAAPSVRARPTPAPSVPAPLAARPEPPAPPAPAPKPQVAGPPDSGLRPSVSGRMGCDDPLGIHLNEQQLQACANNRAKLAREAKPFDNIPAGKKAEYDRVARCQDARREREVPSMDSGSGPPKPTASNVNPLYGANVGMGKGYGFCP